MFARGRRSVGPCHDNSASWRQSPRAQLFGLRPLSVGRWLAKGGDPMATATRDMTRDELYREAKRLGIKGRSKMTKGLLKAAVDRRRSS
jgi:hypothetical protein